MRSCTAALDMPIGFPEGRTKIGGRLYDPMTAMIAGTVGSAVIGGISSNSAAKTQAGAANRATDLQRGIYDQNQANLSPYMQQGGLSSTRLAELLGLGGNTGAEGYGSLLSKFTAQDYLNNQDPGYQFQLQQGQQALQNSQAAGDGVLSGAALKGLIGYNQGMASTGYQNAFDRFQAQNTNTYNRLLGMSGLGENAAAGAGNTGATIGANMAGTITGAGNAAAAGQIGVGNAISGGINNGLGYYYLNSLLGKGGGAPSGSMYGGIGQGYDSQNGSDVGFHL